MKAVIAIIISIVTDVDGIVHVGYCSIEMTQFADITIWVNVMRPGIKATQCNADVLFDANRVLCDASNIGFQDGELLVGGGNSVIKASLLVADVGDVAVKASLHLQETIQTILLFVFRSNITITAV